MKIFDYLARMISIVVVCSFVHTVRAELVVIEPDNYLNETNLTAEVQSVELRVADELNAPYDLFTVTANSIAPQAAPTGQHVFGHSNIAFWPSSRRFYARFFNKTNEVSIKFTGGDGINPERGTLRAYDEQGNLLSDYLTAPLLPGAVETMRVSRPAADISYIVAYTPVAYGSFGKLDYLKFNDNPLSPDISVQQPVGSELTDGSAIVGYGDVAIGSSAERSFVVRNTGTAELTNLAINISGSNEADFSAGTLAVTTLAPGAETSFTVSFAPTAGGSRTATLHIASNDADENPFDITLNGMGPPVPEIVVEHPVGTSLADGEASVVLGETTIGVPTTKTITIRNSGNENLTGLAVTHSGENASDFMLGALGATTLAPGGETTFMVTFTPTVAGLRAATLQIASNDSDENPFDIVLRGAGLTPAPEIVVQHPSGTNLVDGDGGLTFGFVNIGVPVSKTVMIRNTGTATLEGLALERSGASASDYTLGALEVTALAPGAETSFTVTFTPREAGSRLATLRISSNDANENPFDINLTGTALVLSSPEIVVQHSAGINLEDGVSTLGFGDPIIGTPVTKTFTVRNIGTANLTGLVVTRSGDNASDFVLGALGSTTLAPAAITTFTVTFTPSSASIRRAAIHIASNDANENPFDVNLSGTGSVTTAPEIVVEEPEGTILVDGTATLVFANSNIGSSVEKRVTVRNTGTANLTGLAVTRSGTNSSDFALGTLGATTLAPGASTSFSVIFTPTETGTRRAAIQIASNDANENPFDIKLSGTGVFSRVPDIVVEVPEGTILVDDTAALEFGNSNIGAPVTKTVIVRNTGTASLTGLAVIRSGPNASEFESSVPGLTTLVPGASTTFTVTFVPAEAGTRSAGIQILSNDADENPFAIRLSGVGLALAAPEITVQQGKGSEGFLKDNQSVREFGLVKIGKASKVMEFTIKNDGTAPLKMLDVTVKGKQAKDFKIVKKPAKSVDLGKSTQFKVVFQPGKAMVSKATLQIGSNDADENPFRVKLSGKGVK